MTLADNTKDNKVMTEDVRVAYIVNEAQKGFKDWTELSLDFALKNYELPKKVKEQIKQKLEEI